MGEGSLDDQLRGGVMWSSITDAVDMSNSSSSLSTEERHSNAPGSVSEILTPKKKKQPTNPDEAETHLRNVNLDKMWKVFAVRVQGFVLDIKCIRTSSD